DVAPAPGARVALTRLPDLVILARELVLECAVPLVPAQSIGQVPRQRQHQTSVAHERSVGDDILAEAALISLLFLDARRKDTAEIPLAVFVLADMHVRVLRLEAAE